MPENADPSLLPPSFKPIFRELKTEPLDLLRRWERDDSAFAKALLAGTEPTIALGELGVRLCLQNRYAESIDVLTAALAMAPDKISLMNDLAVVHERAGQTELAIPQVQRSLKLGPTQTDSWIFLGNLKQKQADLTAAAAAFETALSLDAGSVISWQCLGLVRQEQRQFPAAIECFRACIRLNHAPAAVLSILGQLFYSTGQFQKSRDAYTAALDGDPQNRVYRQMMWEMQFVSSLIDGENIDQSLNAYIINHAGFTLERDTEQLLHKVFALLSSFGYTDAARIVAEKRLALFPASASAQYFAAAMDGRQLPRSPDQYIIESFDNLAERFDEHLTEELAYDIPQKLAAALAGFVPAGTKLNMLDAGCGTGLCGPYVRPISRSLTGVDLSPKMLDQARKLELYDSLVCGELTEFLYNTTDRFEAIIAADVLIYFGDLAPLASAMANATTPGGLLAFSIECCDPPGCQLRSSGRFAHDPAYVRAVFGAGFEELCCKETIVRMEATRAVAGKIFVMQKRPAQLPQTN